LINQAISQENFGYLRNIIHETCPDVEEDIKWGTPHYSYKGDHLCMMAGFKNHVSFSLYKAELMKDKAVQDSVKSEKNSAIWTN